MIRPIVKSMAVAFLVASFLSSTPSGFAKEDPKNDDNLPKQRVFDLGDDVKLEMILIPAGSFEMGDPKGRDNEKPVHKVTISKPFFLGKYEITQEQWENVMGRNPSAFKGSDHPVECVSWNDCQQFLERLNRKLRPIKAKFRLPTEAQWEYACRAGGAGTFCCGNEEKKLHKFAWFDDNAKCKTHPVGRKKPNAWGLFDMHGNVWEWCADWYGADYYSQSPACDPNGPLCGTYRALRGGCWAGLATVCRTTNRHARANPKTFRNNTAGLRVACPATNPDQP